MASLSNRIKNTGYMANEIGAIGMSAPPNNLAEADMMGAASTALRSVARVNTTDSQNTGSNCRAYSGFAGLRRLQQDQRNNTFYDPGCGWMYKQEAGATNPSINRGVFATYNGVPVYGRQGQPDELTGGSITMDLQLAEQNAAKAVADGLGNSCVNMQNLGTSNLPLFGYCKSTNKIIPIETYLGAPRARFNNSTNNMNCASSNIVTASAGAAACTASGFRNQEAEGFDNSDRLQSQQQCQLPFTRDCLIQSVRNAGCTDQGSLMSALSSAPSGAPYDTTLETSKAYRYYTQKVNIPSALLKTGGGVETSQAASDIFIALAQTANSPTADPGAQGQYAAAKDLCLQRDFFKNTYNFCAELTASTTINATNIDCVQNLWRNAGGASKGTEYPELAKWSGSNVGNFIEFRDAIVEKTTNADKIVQAGAIKQLIGSETITPQASLDLVKNTNTRGTEVVWFYTGNANTTVIIRSDLMMASDTGGIPDITSQIDFVNKFALPASQNMCLTAAFEYRPSSNTQVAFKILVSEGFMIGYNQNPFEGTNNLDWGSWRGQPPTTFTSSAYNISTSSPTDRNVFVVKYFKRDGPESFNLSIAEGATPFANIARNASAKQNLYLTQEPLAPWLRYEVCTRPNEGNGSALGFFETRFNGPVSSDNQKGKFSFDTSFKSIVHQTDPTLRIGVPGSKPYASYNSSSQWMTYSMFAYSAFKTITLMIRPTSGTQATQYAGIFSHGQNPTTENARVCNLYLKYASGIYSFSLVTKAGAVVSEQSSPCTANAWNLVVIQYIDTDGYGIRGISLHSAPYLDLNTGQAARTALLGQMQGSLTTNSPIQTPKMRSQIDINRYAGKLFLGYPPWPLPPYQASASFTGDIAWLHGFRNYISSDSELLAEIQQTWISRWPVPQFNSSVAASANMQVAVGNNGSVSCDMYCAGVSGKSWNNELPLSWNGAKCVNSSDPAFGCSGVPGMTRGPYCEGGVCPQTCTCAATGNGWYAGDYGWSAPAFQSPRLPVEMSDSRSRTQQAEGFRTQANKFNPNYIANSERAYVSQQAPKTVASSLFSLFKW